MYTTLLRFPDAPLTESLVHTALCTLDTSVVVANARTLIPSSTRVLQWCTYDELDHTRILQYPDSILASSYIIRKALIRKHYLHRTLSSYVVKQPSSVLANALPRTWDLDITWADELDDLLVDELWDLGKALDDATENPRWYILKPGMADRGIGIRLFESKDTLRTIFEEFYEESDTEDGVEIPKESNVVTSQLRHFVIQEYLSDPLLTNPAHSAITQLTSPKIPFKFHLRAYCVASGALTLYLWPHILALFSAAPYAPPSRSEHGNIELAPHLTNTSLHANPGEANVLLLSELVGLPILSRPGSTVLSMSDIANITDQTAEILSEAFRAALASPVHFQPLPNAFELFGADLLITHASNGFQVTLLEFNTEPAIELTGSRLRWVLEDMFKAIAKVCVGPFFGIEGCKWDGWGVGEFREGLRKCLELQVRGTGGW